MRSCPQAERHDPPRPIGEGGIPAEALIAQVVVSKYADHLPLQPYVATKLQRTGTRVASVKVV